MAERHIVAAVDEIPPGGRKRVTVKGRDIALFNVKGEFFALLDRCPHEGASLCQGKIVGLAESDGPGHYRLVRQGEMLRCPWHGWQYDIRTGQSWCDPDNIKLRNYPVTIEPGEKVAKGPYVVETFTVSIDKEYVVLEL